MKKYYVISDDEDKNKRKIVLLDVIPDSYSEEVVSEISKEEVRNIMPEIEEKILEEVNSGIIVTIGQNKLIDILLKSLDNKST